MKSCVFAATEMEIHGPESKSNVKIEGGIPLCLFSAAYPPSTERALLSVGCIFLILTCL
jgi:hypothetical protein